ncbi:MAG: type II toxin-antitoxin system Phd/YefM family antitoxin [Candidatus Xenobia bacterium]
MDREITATEAARTFSEILNSVRFQGVRYTILRGGKPVAAIVPVGEPPTQLAPLDVGSVLSALPRLGDDAEAFADDLEWVAAHQPSLRAGGAWE